MKYWRIIFLSLLIWSFPSFAKENILNVYTWSEEIPEEIIKQFEKETGIKVNYSSFDSNEVMFAKLRTNRKGYDVVEPSSNYIDRMKRQGLLEKLDRNQLPNFKNIDPFFTNQVYDPHSQYSIPFIWGLTGLVINQDHYKKNDTRTWSDLLNPQFTNRLMLLDEPRGVFSIAFRMLGYSINDTDPKHIKEAYLKLKELMPNIRLFNSDAVISIFIDEDATIGTAWNGDYVKAHLENPKLQFIFPEEGFEMWVDNFVIMQGSPHRANAYQFLNFLMRPDVAKAVSLTISYSTTNREARKLMPENIRNDPILYPSYEVLKHGEFQSDIGEKASNLIEKYWEFLKMGG
jgi:spermidine/putrescine transport system substrate-binding protein